MNTGLIILILVAVIVYIVVIIVMVIKILVSTLSTLPRVAALPRDEARRIEGGVALLVGVVLALYGINSINSASSQLARAMDEPDQSGIIAIGIGVIIGVIGIVLLSSKGRLWSAGNASTTRKCPFCAETIQAEAKLCRFCGKTLETSSTNQL